MSQMGSAFNQPRHRHSHSHVFSHLIRDADRARAKQRRASTTRRAPLRSVMRAPRRKTRSLRITFTVPKNRPDVHAYHDAARAGRSAPMRDRPHAVLTITRPATAQTREDADPVVGVASHVPSHARETRDAIARVSRWSQLLATTRALLFGPACSPWNLGTVSAPIAPIAPPTPTKRARPRAVSRPVPVTYATLTTPTTTRTDTRTDTDNAPRAHVPPAPVDPVVAPTVPPAPVVPRERLDLLVQALMDLGYKKTVARTLVTHAGVTPTDTIEVALAKALRAKVPTF